MASAQRNGRRMILVVNGLPSIEARESEGARLLEWGFRNFEDDKILSKDEVVDQAKVWLGNEEQVPLVVEQDVTLTLPIAKRADLKMTVSYKGPVEAPVKKGTVIGKLHIMVPDQGPMDVDLMAGRDVERQGLFGRVSSRLHYLLYGA
jgi:D-alanyl-D-alanine carboxypeptidase (penicillin-binding protein 5/6)